MAKSRRAFSPEFKYKVVMEYLSGQKRRVEILREYELSDSTLERWYKQFQERAPQVFAAGVDWDPGEEKQIAELERIIGRLTVELEAAKKVSRRLKSQ